MYLSCIRMNIINHPFQLKLAHPIRPCIIILHCLYDINYYLRHHESEGRYFTTFIQFNDMIYALIISYNLLLFLIWLQSTLCYKSMTMIILHCFHDTCVSWKQCDMIIHTCTTHNYVTWPSLLPYCLK